MVHGLDSHAGTWGEQGDAGFGQQMGFAQYLDDLGWPIDGCGVGTAEVSQPQADPCFQRIDLPTQSESRERLALRLKTSLDEIATRLGVRELHLVGHSMGGLISREYLSGSYLNQDALRVKSLVTLATPHDGAEAANAAVALAVISSATAAAKSFSTLLTYAILALGSGFPIPVAQGQLTTFSTAAFNRGTLSSLRDDALYFAFGADASSVVPGSITDADETRAFDLLQPFSDPDRVYFGDLIYKATGALSYVEFGDDLFCVPVVGCYVLVGGVPLWLPYDTPPNDLVVPRDSAFGMRGGFNQLSTPIPVNGNHGNIKRQSVAKYVYVLLRELEKLEDGGLR